jgi:beta-xylosidase
MPQWKFFGEYDTSRYLINKQGLAIKAKGTSVGDCSPLLCVPYNHSYTADVEFTIEGEATAGLVLFYNSNFHSGILADSRNILANLRGWQFVTEKDVINRHGFLRIRNINNTVDMYYSTDGKSWNKIESSVEVSGYHHNVLSGFLSLRIGLCSIGNGMVSFRHFTYKTLD